MTEMKMKGMTNAKRERGRNTEAEPKSTAKGRGDGQPHSTGLSQAKLNVTKTMIYIVISFALCWMPKGTYSFYKMFMVMHLSLIHI